MYNSTWHETIAETDKEKAGTEIMRTKTKIRGLDLEASRVGNARHLLREAGDTVTQRHIKRYVCASQITSNRFIHLSSNQLSADKSTSGSHTQNNISFLYQPATPHDPSRAQRPSWARGETGRPPATLGGSASRLP